MRASKRLITSVIALIVSVVLCIGVCIAWFSSNKSVDGTGMSASLGMNIEEFTVTAYAISVKKDESGNVITDENGKITGTQGSQLTDGKMYAYRNLDDKDTAVLLKFDYTFKQSNSKSYGIYAQLNKTVTNTNNATVEETTTADTYKSGLFSAVSFYSVVSLDGTTVTWSASAISEDENGTLVTLNSVTAPETLSGTFYCVMDYDGDKISALYTAVAGLGGSLWSKINFTGDIEFYIGETGQNV